MNLKCIIIEDEPLAVNVMKDYIQQIPFLELIAVCNDAISAMQKLSEHQIDLMFLDLHLPKVKGLDFLAAIKNPPKVIITTAYHEFAVESYKYQVLDYLLKPIEFERFVTSVLKALPVDSKSDNQKTNEPEFLFFTVNKKRTKIQVSEILYIESQKENIKIVLREKTIITRHSISELEKTLPSDFIRIHRSFIISKNKIDTFDSQSVEIQNKSIPIGRNYKNYIKDLLEY
ncbi:LytR/AlgR family response regulator transcription factor [Epilithonimonas pallida]|uniref:Two component transcriptional regulator, LytTR family n=1 Tax=Epilithonimonas pallida TaxID=373671 RepID=A0ABY1R1Q9_9FLAO|nr:LytTR family DNA-binding domain-containing protein [Epilithonimonas pallida]SMP92528.1 two component transcriptional regulator, LytTR family [Epilithonimonas pallida]